MIKLLRSKLAKKPSQEIEDDVADQINCQLIHGDRLKVIKDIGDGQYGFVKLGEWTHNNGKKRYVAIKYMKDAAAQLITEIVKEASIMQTLQHENILIFHGISFPMDGQPQLRLVIEFSPLGSLLGNLKKDMSGVRQVSVLNRFAVQIASGMQYLASLKLVHRDLATRNILVFDNDMVKISDFGLARAMGNSGVLELTVGRRMPFAWCSPEILSKSLYSLASDVWSYGVTLWEMYSFGEAPWRDLDVREVLKVVTTAPVRRLEKPLACPDSVYEVMMRCWEYEQEKRPSFQEIHKSVEELHPKQLQTKTFHQSTNEDLLNYRDRDIITVISSSNKESQAGLWLGQHINGQIGLFEKRNTRVLRGSKRTKKRGKNVETELPCSPPGFVRYGLPLQQQEERDEERDEEEEEEEIFQTQGTSGRPNLDEPGYVSMNRDMQCVQRSQTEEGAAHDHDHDYVSIQGAAFHHGSSAPTAGAFLTQREQGTTPGDDISIPGISSRLENGASHSVPTDHAFPSEHEQRTISADDISTTGAHLGPENEASQPPSWVTLPRNQKPPRIPERVDLIGGRKVPNGEGAGCALRGGAIAEAPNAKRKAPVPAPRKKSTGTNPRPSHQNELTMAKLTCEKQVPRGAPFSEMGLSDDRVPPVGAEGDPCYFSPKGPSEGDEVIYERPWVGLPNPIYDVPKRSGSLPSGSEPIYAQPKRPPLGAESAGDHVYDLPDRVPPHSSQGHVEHIYERADLLPWELTQSTRPQSDTVGQEHASPPLPTKDIISRETSRLPEPLQPVPLSPTSQTTTVGFPFTSGSHSDMMSSVMSPFMLPPPPEIPEETLHQFPPENAFDESPFSDLEPSFSGMTLDFQKSHSVHEKLPSEGKQLQVVGGRDARQGDIEENSSLGEERRYLIQLVRDVWPAAEVDWCCAAFMQCNGDSTQILCMAKVEQVHSITRKEKERCLSTLQHCNWDVFRAVNWLLDEG